MDEYDKTREQLYVAYLEIMKSIVNENFKKSKNEILIDYQMISKYYEEDNLDKIEEYNNETCKKLLEYARNESRYPVINTLIYSLLKNLVILDNEDIDNRDLFFIKNLGSISELLAEENDFYRNFSKEQKIDIPNISKTEYERTVSEILKMIDPSLEWLDFYNQMKLKNKIIFLDELTYNKRNRLEYELGRNLDEINACCIKYRKGILIILNSRKKLDAIPATIHELSHAISFGSREEYIGKTTKEYISIFYELFSMFYLEKIGYKTELINQLIGNLFHIIYKNRLFVNNIIRYILKYISNNGIKESEEIKIIQKQISELETVENGNESLMKFKQANPLLFDAKKQSNIRIDACINIIISNNYYKFYELYPYVVGSFLARKALENMKIDSEKTLKTLKNHTDHLNEIDPYDIFVDLGIDTQSIGLRPSNEQEKMNKHKKNIE